MKGSLHNRIQTNYKMQWRKHQTMIDKRGKNHFTFLDTIEPFSIFCNNNITEK